LINGQLAKRMLQIKEHEQGGVRKEGKAGTQYTDGPERKGLLKKKTVPIGTIKGSTSLRGGKVKNMEGDKEKTLTDWKGLEPKAPSAGGKQTALELKN